LLKAAEEAVEMRSEAVSPVLVLMMPNSSAEERPYMHLPPTWDYPEPIA
jgi:hypothetical protein